MTLDEFRYFYHRARSLPPGLLVKKAFQHGKRRLRGSALRLADFFRPAYGRGVLEPLPLPLKLSIDDIPEGIHADLKYVTDHYIAHRFDLLGSGWTSVAYGASVDGLCGIRFDADDTCREIAKTRNPAALVSRANRRISGFVYGLIAPEAGYEPIDWQRDFRSGYRWRNDRYFTRLSIGTVRGADIKWPWELSRMQHLPRLALAAIAANAGVEGFREASVYVAEIRNEILDFIATNPPRFGACWGCPMDVGIRAANWAIAYSLLAGSGFTMDHDFRGILGGSLRDHAEHIVDNLEWSETGRSNHYLADLVGLAFSAASLPRSEVTRGWLAFSAKELIGETRIQFHEDGGNYEGSTNYHRLSTELVAYGIALTAGLLRSEPDSLRLSRKPSIRGRRPPASSAEASLGEGLMRLRPRLAAVLQFCRTIDQPGGSFVQIGDTDSGRLMKLTPDLEGDGKSRRENDIAMSEVTATLAALLGEDGAPGRNAPAAAIIKSLCREPLPHRAISDEPSGPSQPGEVHPDELAARLAALPEDRRRTTLLRIGRSKPARASLRAFPDFGLYRIDTESFCLFFRCAPHRNPYAPTGHTHDDNLSIELIGANAVAILDPGTFVYTPLPELRNLYRSSAAHFQPRASDWPAVEYSSRLFELTHRAKARCLHASPAALAGVLEGEQGRVYRLIRIVDEGVEIIDGCDPGPLAPLEQPPVYCEGYGKQTARPAFIV